MKKQRPSVPTNPQTIATGATKKRREEEEKQDDDQETEDEEADNSSSNTSLASVDPLPVEPVAKEHLGDLPYFLLNYDDSIGDTCDVNKRTPAQTKDFKERLHKAIRLVDTQLYKSPPGTVCTRDCKKLREKMCKRMILCRGPVCSVWHAIEVHSQRCPNGHCELHLRVYIREMGYKIDEVKLRIEALNAQLQRKQ